MKNNRINIIEQPCRCGARAKYRHSNLTGALEAIITLVIGVSALIGTAAFLLMCF